MGRFIESRPATRQKPCPLCGKTDHCWSANYGSEGWLYYCAKVSDTSVFGRDGVKYLLKDNRAFPGGRSGGYFVYEAEEQQLRNREEYIAKLKADNPNWKPNPNYKKQSRKEAVPQGEPMEAIEVDVVNPLPNEKLNEIYRYLLDLLVLEDSHKKALLDEWNASSVHPGLGERILEHWPIKSLPMNDWARKNSGAALKNKTRRQIVDAMVKQFGNLKGVPGFYLETSKWIDKVTGEQKEHTHWQIINLSGIVYPQYDSDGNIYRIRIGDEHPVLQEYAKDSGGNYLYEVYERQVWVEGQPHIIEDKKKAVCADILWDKRTGEWVREDRATKKRTILYSRQKGITSVKITDKGYPKIDGKVDGKYKNFSSYFRKEVQKGNKILAYNGYAEGTRSGSQVSIFTRPGDKMKYVYITEGEKKAIVMNEILHCPVIALPGVHTFSKLFEKEYGKQESIMDHLIRNGLAAVIVVYDADKAVNDAVLSAESGLLDLCKSKGITTFVGSWDPHFGKGADDILIIGKQLDIFQR